MDDLISREWVLKNLMFDVDRDVVRKAPKVDDAPIVMCKDCSRFHDHGYPWTLGWCGNLGKAVAKDFYCADWRGKVYAAD